MRCKFCLVLLFTIISISNAIAQDIFSLKGKNIILASDKIACGAKYQGGNGLAPYYSSHFGKLYTNESLTKNKFSKKYLCHDNIIGKKLFVSDVYVINPDKLKKKAIVMLLSTDSNKYILHLPLYIKTEDYIGGFRVYLKPEPERISLLYYDYDAIERANKQYCSKAIYFGVKDRSRFRYFGNKPSMIDSFAISDNRLYVYKDGEKKEIQPNNTAEYYTISSHSFEKTTNPLEEYLSSIKLEEEIISECKQEYNIAYVDSIKNIFLNKEVYYSTNERGFYQCTYVGIKNIGEKEPNYHYVMTLTNDKRNEDVIVAKFMMDYIELANEYREKKRIEREEEERKRAEYQAMLDKEEVEYKAVLIRKYGKRNALLILDNIVKLGFTKEMCIEAWGEPYDINRTITNNGIHEQWVYDIGRYLYFEGNILTAIQD